MKKSKSKVPASTTPKTNAKDEVSKPRSRLPLLFAVLAIAIGIYLKFSNKLENKVNIIDENIKPRNLNIQEDEINKDSVPKGANTKGAPRPAEKDCIDRHFQCSQFASNGECQRNPGWMIINCPASCNNEIDACALRDPKLRCGPDNLDMSFKPIYAPGDMNKMFSSIPSRFSDRYKVNVISTSPWVVTFDNFLTDDEINALITNVPRWERSTDTGSMNEFGEAGRILSSGRTSSNGWCIGECETNPYVQNIARKIEEITGVPYENYESFQILKYELGQKYNTHHDSSEDDNKIPCGPRILTFFLYLSDVEEGGETHFPRLNITVKPKKGMALLWPSTLDEDPSSIDYRTYHAALPVIKGVKYAANSWIHLYNYHVPNLWGCTGSFDEL